MSQIGHRVRVSGMVLTGTVLATIIWVNAGSLTPPAGPIAPTMKTLSDVEPRTALRNDFVNIIPIVISSPGSYYLAEDIYAIHSHHGIEVTTNNVTLDLNGFTVYGNVEVGSLDGIQVTGNRTNVTVRNGVVRDFFGHGVDLTSVTNFLVEGVLAVNNIGDGIRAGHNGVVDRCTATNNGDHGIFTGNSVVVSRSTATSNGEDGIDTGQSCVVSSCTVRDNEGNGIDATLSTVEHCTATGNTLDGIMAYNSTVTGCSALLNSSDGVQVEHDSYVYGNNCRSNVGSGIRATGSDNRIDSNNVIDNASGIDLGSANRNVIIRNTASNNSVFPYLSNGDNDWGPVGTAENSTSAWTNFWN